MMVIEQLDKIENLFKSNSCNPPTETFVEEGFYCFKLSEKETIPEHSYLLMIIERAGYTAKLKIREEDNIIYLQVPLDLIPGDALACKWERIWSDLARACSTIVVPTTQLTVQRTWAPSIIVAPTTQLTAQRTLASPITANKRALVQEDESISDHNKITKQKKPRIQTTSQKSVLIETVSKEQKEISLLERQLKRAQQLGNRNGKRAVREGGIFDEETMTTELLWSRLSDKTRRSLTENLTAEEMEKVKEAYFSSYITPFKQNKFDAITRATKLGERNAKLFANAGKLFDEKKMTPNELWSGLQANTYQGLTRNLTPELIEKVKEAYVNSFITQLKKITQLKQANVDVIDRARKLGRRNAGNAAATGRPLDEKDMTIEVLWSRLSDKTRTRLTENLTAETIQKVKEAYVDGYITRSKQDKLDVIIRAQKLGRRNARDSAAKGLRFENNITIEDAWQSLSSATKTDLIHNSSEEEISKVMQEYGKAYIYNLKKYQRSPEEAKRRLLNIQLKRNFFKQIPLSDLRIYRHPNSKEWSYAAIISFEGVANPTVSQDNVARLFNFFINKYYTNYLVVDEDELENIETAIIGSCLIIKNYGAFYDLFKDEMEEAGFPVDNKKLTKCPETLSSVINQATTVKKMAPDTEKASNDEHLYSFFYLESSNSVDPDMERLLSEFSVEIPQFSDLLSGFQKNFLLPNLDHSMPIPTLPVSEAEEPIIDTIERTLSLINSTQENPYQLETPSSDIYSHYNWQPVMWSNPVSQRSPEAEFSEEEQVKKLNL